MVKACLEKEFTELFSEVAGLYRYIGSREADCLSKHLGLSLDDFTVMYLHLLREKEKLPLFLIPAA